MTGEEKKNAITCVSASVISFLEAKQDYRLKMKKAATKNY